MSANQIFVCNAGSSSLKVDVFAFSPSGSETLLASAKAGRLGAGAKVKIEFADGRQLTPDVDEKAEHGRALRLIVDELLKGGVFAPEDRLAAGHRIVHGAHLANRPLLLDDAAIEIVERCAEFAPLHNPANLKGIRAGRELFGIPQVGVFDTAFHANMPPEAYTYALPRERAARLNLRRFGFHGTSHEYVGRLTAQLLGKPFEELKLISLHLGNGASVCAIRNGISIDTSMGFTPLEGLVMGTRSGDLDPALVLRLMEADGLSPDETDRILNKESGLKGICGHNDMRDILARAKDGDEACALARDVFAYRIRKYTGAYLAALGGADAIIFTGGIGENSAEIRAAAMKGLEGLGIRLDATRNSAPAREGHARHKLSADDSAMAIFAVPTDEELMIARKALEVVKSA